MNATAARCTVIESGAPAESVTAPAATMSAMNTSVRDIGWLFIRPAASATQTTAAAAARNAGEIAAPSFLEIPASSVAAIAASKAATLTITHGGAYQTVATTSAMRTTPLAIRIMKAWGLGLGAWGS